MVKKRKEVRWFSDQMELVLLENDHKGGWQHCSNNVLLIYLNNEMQELKEALINQDINGIIKESIDISNFAMMIADNNHNKRKNYG